MHGDCEVNVMRVSRAYLAWTRDIAIAALINISCHFVGARSGWYFTHVLCCLSPAIKSQANTCRKFRPAGLWTASAKYRALAL